MSSEAAIGAASGAAQGAAVGSVVPVIGTAIGAVVGGIIGLVGGLSSSKSKKAKKKELAIRQRMAEREAAIQRRDLVRQIRIQRAQQVAAGTSEDAYSSLVQGAISSTASQGASSIGFFDTQIGLNAQANRFGKKADQYAGQAAAAGTLLNSMGSLASIGSSVYGMYRKSSLQPVTITGAASKRMPSASSLLPASSSYSNLATKL